ncbi:MAG: hypothetical protein ABUL62_31915 [Myxococcales bacterium]
MMNLLSVRVPLGLLALLTACGGKSVETSQVAANGGGSAEAGSPASRGGAGTAQAGEANAGASGAGSGVGIDDCTSNADCRLVARGCCSCGTGPLSSFAAINNASVDAYYAQQCSPGTNCGACPPIEPNLNAPESYYIATCSAGHCVAVDLRADALTDCAVDSDCQMRNSANCCDTCEATPNIALNKDAEPKLESLVCGTSTACQACERKPPPPMGVGVRARCSAGKCELTGYCNMCF